MTSSGATNSVPWERGEQIEPLHVDQVDEYVRVRDGNPRRNDRRHGLLRWQQNLRVAAEILQAGLHE